MDKRVISIFAVIQFLALLGLVVGLGLPFSVEGHYTGVEHTLRFGGEAAVAAHRTAMGSALWWGSRCLLFFSAATLLLASVGAFLTRRASRDQGPAGSTHR